MNWRGRRLKTPQIIVDLISNTTTATGLTKHCVLDTGEYPTGITHTDEDVAALPSLATTFTASGTSLEPADTP